jgi:DNA-binding Lrp family transcriptional regulator
MTSGGSAPRVEKGSAMEDMAAIVGRRTRPARAPAATERVRKLEAAGVITGYRSTVNLQALGYNIRAIVRVGRAEYMRIVKMRAADARGHQCL